MVIEDDEDDVFLLERALDRVRDRLKIEVQCERAEDGLEGLFRISMEDVTEALPDALVLDLNMPRLGGVQFLRALRQSLLLKDLPVFVLTTTTSGSIHEEALQAGADRVYVKPNDADALSDIAGEIVEASCNAAVGRLGAP
jgi:CheY-like chemotaxis protein